MSMGSSNPFYEVGRKQSLRIPDSDKSSMLNGVSNATQKFEMFASQPVMDEN